MTQTRTELGPYFRPHISTLEPYVPIETLQGVAIRLKLPEGGVSKLDFNENPYGPSPLVYEALAKLRGAHLYSDPLASDLREALSEYTGVAASRILVGAGEDELIGLLTQLFLDPADVSVEVSPTYTMYGALASQAGARIVHVPRGEGWELDVPAVLNAITSRTKLIWVCSPNNPTGNSTSEAAVLPLLDTGVPVVVDEAYWEFSGRSFVALLGRYQNLILLRTFSKLHGLAGLRVGYMLASEELIAHVLKIKLPFNVSTAGQVAALASLEDQAWLREQVGLLLRERDRMAEGLREHGVMLPYPSEASFILCEVRGDARALRADLGARGVFVRYIGKPRVENCLRITAGRPEDTDHLLTALHEVRPRQTGLPPTAVVTDPLVRE